MHVSDLPIMSFGGAGKERAEIANNATKRTAWSDILFKVYVNLSQMNNQEQLNSYSGVDLSFITISQQFS